MYTYVWCIKAEWARKETGPPGADVKWFWQNLPETGAHRGFGDLVGILDLRLSIEVISWFK